MLGVLISLSLLLGQSTTDQSLSSAPFQIERAGIRLEPDRQAILLNPDGPPIEFRLVTGLSTDANTLIRASLIGPGLSQPVSIQVPGEDLRITLARTHFTQEGLYQLVNVRLEKGGQVLAFSEPRTADIQVAEKFAVTEVSVRNLSRAELLELGYVFNEDDYQTVNFELAVTLDTEEEKVTTSIPVAFPKIRNSSFTPVVLEDPFQPFIVQPLRFFLPRDGDRQDGGEPPEGTASWQAMGVILIPGNFRYLKSHFEVTCLLLNATPEGFDVRIHELSARVHLPRPEAAGEPLLLREPAQQAMINLGEDDEPGTADDRTDILAGERASARYILVGNLPGMHEVEVEISGLLQLPQGSEPFTALAQGTVYVRSPSFGVSFEHPDAVEEGEAYDLVININNRGQTPLEDFKLTLDPEALINVRLAAGTQPVQTAGDIPVGGQASLTYRLVSQINGRATAGFFKADSAVENAITLRAAVGDLGQTISPYSLHFPREFTDRFPAYLVQSLRRYAKKVFDVALTAPHELPPDLAPLPVETARRLNGLMALAGKSRDLGITPRESLVQLFSLWVRSVDEHEAMDLVRRKVINQGELPLEDQFAQALVETFGNVSAEELLQALYWENETTPNLSLFLVEADQPIDMALTDAEFRTSQPGGPHNIPFSSVLPLSPNRTLIWVSGLDHTPLLCLEPMNGSPRTVTIQGMFPRNGGGAQSFHLQDLTIDSASKLGLDPQAERVDLQRAGQETMRIPTAVVAAKPFSLLSFEQPDRRNFSEADHMGRDFVAFFSKPLSLQSLDPLADHIQINGLAAVDARLQEGGRALFVTSALPLGPYKPIPFRISDITSTDGQTIGLETGIIQGSASLTGAFVTGSVTDHQRSDLGKAKAFLWSRDFEFPTRGGALPWKILHSEIPDGQGRFSFPFVPGIPFPDQALVDPQKNRFRTFRIGVLLEDGRYEERTFFPQGVGQEIFAEFAFLSTGTVQGRVLSDQGQPVPFADVFVTSQANPLSAQITTTNEQGFYSVAHMEVGAILVKSALGSVLGLGTGFLSQETSPLTVDVVIGNPTATIRGAITARQGDASSVVDGAVIGFALQGGLTQVIPLDGAPISNSPPFSVFAISDADGRFDMPDVPAGSGSFWVYHPVFGLHERVIQLPENATLTLDYEYQVEQVEYGVVSGFVRTQSGDPIADASVLQGDQRVLTDANGAFEIDFVPKNQEVRLLARHPEYGQSSVTLTLQVDRLDNQLILLNEAVTISGTYLDAAGDPLPFATIYRSGLPGPGGQSSNFEAVAQTDFAGHWSTQLAHTGTFDFTAYAPPAIAAMTNVPVQGANIADLVIQQTELAPLRVQLLDANGQPIVGKIDLTSFRPNSDPTRLGLPEFTETHRDEFTDAEGYVLFEAINVGAFSVRGHLEDRETPVISGQLLPHQGGEPQTIVLAFEPELEPANLFGRVYEADGVTPAPEGTLLTLKAGSFTSYQTVSGGGIYRFDQLPLGSEPVRVQLIAYNRTTEHFATAYYDLNQTLQVRHDLILKRKGILRVRVVQADGSPAEFAAVQVSYEDADYIPASDRVEQTKTLMFDGQVTPQEPIFQLDNVPSGAVSLATRTGNGLVGLRDVVMPFDGGPLEVSVRLEPATSISGTFFDRVNTPIPGAEVGLFLNSSRLQQRVTGAIPGEEGRFQFPELPTKQYVLRGEEPATGLAGHLQVTTSAFQPNPEVELILDPVGHLEGLVTHQGQPVANTTLTLKRGQDSIITGTDPNGRYRLGNIPLGTYTIVGTAPSIPLHIYREFQMIEPDTTLTLDLDFIPGRDLEILLLNPDGSPAINTLVSAIRDNRGVGRSQLAFTPVGSAYSDDQGRALLPDLILGPYQVLTENPSELNGLFAKITLSEADPDPALRTLQLRGWGSITGQVRDSLGQPLDRPVDVQVAWDPVDDTGLTFSSTRVSFSLPTDIDGRFRVVTIPQGVTVKLSAYDSITRMLAEHTVTIAEHLQELQTDLVFAATASATGTVRYSDGTPAPYARVWVGTPVRHEVLADGQGNFNLFPLVQGNNLIFAKDKDSPRATSMTVEVINSGNGLANIDDLELTLGGVARVTGTVTYADGAPVRFGSVRLTIEGSNQKRTTSLQGDGSFSFGLLPQGTYQLVARDDLVQQDSPVVNAQADNDGQSLEVPIQFPPSFLLSGTLLAPDQTTAVFDGAIELHKATNLAPPQNLLRIYSARSDGTGRFSIERVYPGDYVLKAFAPDGEAQYQADFTMVNRDTDISITLVSASWIRGTIADADEQPFPGATLRLTTAGQVHLLNAGSDGLFAVDGLVPGPFSLAYQTPGSWFSDTVTGVLGPGLNTLPIRTGPTISLSGQAVLAKSGTPSAPRVHLEALNMQQGIPLVAGLFTADKVPAGTPLRLRLSGHNIGRSFDLGPFSSDTDVGSLLLDAIPPEVSLAEAQRTIASLPHSLDLQLNEPEQGSSVIADATRIWVNDVEITPFFQLGTSAATARFSILPEGFVFGANTLRIRTRNDSQAVGDTTIPLNVTLSGTSLSVQLLSNGQPLEGEIRLGGGNWTATDANGRAVFTDVPAGTITLKGRDASGLGRRTLVTISSQPTLDIQLALEPVGTYRGQVLAMDGQPQANAQVSWQGQIELTDSAGNYIFDLLPLGRPELEVNHLDQFGFTKGPPLILPGQTLLDVAIQLQPTGSLIGTVYDNNGSTPIANAAMTLRYQNLPQRFDQTLQADDTGRYQFNRIFGFAFEVEALDSASQRRGFADGQLQTQGEQLVRDVTLTPTGTLGFVVTDQSNQAIDGLEVTLNGQVTRRVLSAVDGRVEFPNVPQTASTYRLTAERSANLEYLDREVTIDQAQVDLGLIQLTLDTPPEIEAVTIANPYDPFLNDRVTVSYRDDRQAVDIKVVFSGVYSGEETRSFSPAVGTVPIFTRIPTDTPAGQLDIRVECRDVFGQLAVQNTSITLAYDSTGPTISFVTPQAQAVFFEGQLLPVEVNTTDLSGIDRVEFLLDGLPITSDSEAPFRQELAAPAVSQTSQITITARAFDQRGNASNQDRIIDVRPIQTQGGPDIDLLAPQDGVALPLSLSAGLDLRVAAQVNDPDGLTDYRLFVMGNQVMQASLNRTEALIETSYTLPESLRGEANLDVQLIVSDLGGNASSVQVTVPALTENFLVYDEANPLTLSRLDVSQDGTDLLLAGGLHTIDGDHAFSNLVLVNGATLSQTATTASDDAIAFSGLEISGTLLIDYGSSIDLAGKGHHRLPNYLGIASGRPSHGGLGQGTADLQQIYGSPFRPTTPGSFFGGGAIKVGAGAIHLLGSILASADPATTRPGAGGSIWLRSENFVGKGLIAANGFSGDFLTSDSEGGGGGRIAIYGAFAGRAEAFGGKQAGAGTVYRRLVDGSLPRGYRDSLTIANHREATSTNLTAIRTLSDVLIGTDAFATIQSVGVSSRHVVDFVSPASLVPTAYLDMRIYRDGDYDTSTPIEVQTPAGLQSGFDERFANPDFSVGDPVQVNYRVDDFIVRDGAHFHFQGQQPEHLIQVAHGALSSGDQAIDLETSGFDFSGTVTLNGNYQFGQVSLDPAVQLATHGVIRATDWLIPTNTTMIHDGDLIANRIEIQANGRIKAPEDRAGTRLHLEAPNLVIAGEVSAQRVDTQLSLPGNLSASHGGAQNTFQTYGSLYHAQTEGNGLFGGGHISLQFDQLELQGVLDASASGTNSAGGSVRLSGTTLTGAGSMSANGLQQSINNGGGGGRIAILVDQIDGFSGRVEAKGTPFSTTTRGNGAGTVFYRTNTWSHGRLVVDNGGISTPTNSTALPGLGYRTTDQASDGTSITGMDYPDYNGLAGLYVEAEGQPPARITANTTTELTPETSFPTLSSGTAYNGLHRFDRLEIRGGAQVSSIDAIEILDELVLDNGTIDSPDLRLPGTLPLVNGSGELLTDPGATHLRLDNYHLTVSFPLNVETIQLANGSSLTYRDAARATAINLDGNSQLIVGTLTGDLQAENLTLSNGSLWTVADRPSAGAPAYPLRGRINGTLAVDASSAISTSGQDKVTGTGFTWGSQTYYNENHAGYNHSSNARQQRESYGSFAKPNHPSTLKGGGLIRISANEIQLAGSLEADGYQSGSGGSIWLDTLVLTGTGRISARSGLTSSTGSGGRIAIYYDQDRGFADTLTFDLDATGSNLTGQGTLFLKGSAQTHGELIVDQGLTTLDTEGSVNDLQRLTGITGPASLTLTVEDEDPDPQVILDSTWTDLPPGLAGLTVSFEVGGQPYQTRVAANSHRSITLETPVPATIPAGTTLHFQLQLDRLELQNGAQLFFAGEVVTPELTLIGPNLVSLQAQNLSGFGTTLDIVDRRLRLILDQPNLDAVTLNLTNSSLFIDKPLTINNLNLVNSSVSHTKWRDLFRTIPQRFIPGVDLTLDTLTADATSGFDVSQRSGYRHRGQAITTHGSPGTGGNAVYGNLFQPILMGSSFSRAGGRIRLRAQVINGGSFIADGSEASGGSVWLEAQTITGSITVSASDSLGGGGRVAIYHGDISAAQLQTTALGEVSPGTVFIKDQSQATGDLWLTNPPDLGVQATLPIPAFDVTSLANGFQQTYDAQLDQSQLTIPGLNLLDSFSGYHLAIDGDSQQLFTIIRHEDQGSDTTLTLAGQLPMLAIGQTIQPALVLNRLIMDRKTTIGPPHLLIIQNLDYPSGHSFSNGDGSFLELPRVAGESLVLDQFHMRVLKPSATSNITLRNGATLEMAVTATSGQPVLSADQILVENGLIQADHLVVSGALTLAADGAIEAFTLGTSPLEWPVGTAIEDRNQGGYSFGGLGGPRFFSNQAPIFNPAYGSYYQPQIRGFGRKALRIEAGSLQVDGTIAPELESASFSREFGAGALWISTSNLSGSGHIHADALANQGGGRMAIHYSDMSAWAGQLSVTKRTGLSVNSGTGTLFLKRQDQVYGELRIERENGMSQIEGSTVLTSLDRVSLSSAASTDSHSIMDPQQTFPPGLAGLFLEFEHGGQPFSLKILNNTPTRIWVDGNMPAIGPGTELMTRAILDRLVLNNGAALRTENHLEVVGSLVSTGSGTPVNRIWASNLTLPTRTLTLSSNEHLGLAIRDAIDLDEILVDGGTLTVDIPLTVDKVHLSNGGVLTHSVANNVRKRLYPNRPLVALSVNQFILDTGATVNVRDKGVPFDSSRAPDEMAVSGPYGSGHGGEVFNMANGYAYGSPFTADSHGFNAGGGRVSITAQTAIINGDINASDSIGGSVFIDTQSLSGDGLIHANGSSGSGGRIAIRTVTNTLSQSPQAKSHMRNHSGTNYQYGAGTIYLYDKTQQTGELRLINDDPGTATILDTPIHTVGTHTLSQVPVDPRILEVPGANWPFSLAGMQVIDDQTNAVYTILANSNERLELDRPVDPAPTIGWSFHGRAPVNSLVTQFANLRASDPLLITKMKVEAGTIDAQLIFDDPVVELRDRVISARSIKAAGRLILHNATLVTESISAAELVLRKGTRLQHPKSKPQEPKHLALDITGALIIERGAVIDLDGTGWSDTDHEFNPSHGGLGSGQPLSNLYDSPIHPSMPGRGYAGGGVLKMTAGTLELHGAILTRGLGYSAGGSVYIETNELSGSGLIQVHGGRAGKQLGGGGRIAIHTPAYHRFSGQIQTGLDTDSMGTLVFAHPDRSGIQLLADYAPTTRALQRGRPLAILPALQLSLTDIRNTLHNPRGSLLEIKTGHSLQAMLGAWLLHDDRAYRVLDVRSFGDQRTFLQLDKRFFVSFDKPIRFGLVIDGELLIQPHPESLELVVLP